MPDPSVPVVPAAPDVLTVPVGQVPEMPSEPGVPAVTDGVVYMPKIVEVHLISANLPGWRHPVQAKVHVSNRTSESAWSHVLETKQARGLRRLGISCLKLLSRCGLQAMD